MNRKALLEHLKVNFYPLLVVIIVIIIQKLFYSKRYRGDSEWIYWVLILLAFAWGMRKSINPLKRYFGTEKSKKDTLSQDIVNAGLGNTDSLYAMALRYQKGDNVEKDIKRANEILLQLANNGHGLSQNAIGLSYLADKQHADEALNWFQKAAENQVDQAFTEIAKIKMKEKSEDSTKQAFDMLAKASQLGNNEGTYLLSLMYLKGQGVSMDRRKGLELLNNAAKKGYSMAIDYMAEILDGKMSFD